MRLILASSSPRRRELLALTGLVFDTARPDIDETPLPGEPGAAYVARLSHAKALAIGLNGAPGSTLILTADTTVVVDDDIIGKPGDPEEAAAMLRRLRGRDHVVHTGISVRRAGAGVADSDGSIETTVITTVVKMRAYSEAEMAAYIASGDPFDKAGGYAVQHAGFRPVAALEGCQANVMGLPVCAACALLARHGLEAPAPPPCSPQHLPCRWQIMP